jgi:radical SAM superfamily enzyme YgiQ (UPF0313 family)
MTGAAANPAVSEPAVTRLITRRVLFLNGNETQRPYRVAPLGMAFVASSVRDSGREVRFMDQLQGFMALRRLVRVLRRWHPQVIGLGIRNLDNSDYHAFHSYLSLPARLVALIRRELPEATIVLGGSAGTVDPERVLDVVPADHLILGEGEEAMVRLLEAKERGEKVSNVVGDPVLGGPHRVVETEKLTPPGLYQWTPMASYLKGDAGYPVQTKRGCPLKCSYCTYGRIEGKRYRKLHPERVADEIQGAMEYGIRDFEFVDSTFNLPVKHAVDVVETLLRRGLTANYHGTGMNPSKLPDELLEGMRRAGFRQVILTAESASGSMLKSYGKNYTLPALVNAADQLRRHRLGALWVFLLAGPGETETTVEESLSFIAEHVRAPDAVYITSGIRIYKGSPMADAWEEGRLGAASLRTSSDKHATFYYSEHTQPDWLEARLKAFQRQHPHVMLSCEGHGWMTQLALNMLPWTGLKKPYWQYLGWLNRLRRPTSFLPHFRPASQPVG